MCEVVSAQMGQAGVQIGNACSGEAVKHGLSLDGRLAKGSPGLSTFFSEASSGKHVPRFLYVDLEQNVVDEVRNGPHRSLFCLETILTGKEDPASGNSKDDVLTVPAKCDRLDCLTLVGCNALSSITLSQVLPSFPNLVAIDLSGVENTSDATIVDLALVAKRLQGISLGGCKEVANEGVLALANNCPLLRRVKLSGLDKLTDKPVSALAKSCPFLLEIDLNGCKLITDHRDTRYLDIFHSYEGSSNRGADELPSLVVPRTFEHLRMLDLTTCSQITAIEGIISYAPKIRNLVKEAPTLFAFGTREQNNGRERANTCRIMYAVEIRWFLYLTGVLAFRQPELQQFCREPPLEFSMTQLLTYCVYSGEGVSRLRVYLTELFDRIREMNGTDDSEYEDGEFLTQPA
ncbi:RNI-like protein [Marasmius fiardii PR-910]|nr:RNI-like protein [Marasmius fiardii PR-910]